MLKTDLEASTKSKLDAEEAYVNLLAEKKILEEKLAGAEAEFTVNFYTTEAYANFSTFFASVGQQEVIAALCTDFLDFDVASLADKFPPVELVDKADTSDPPDE
ncbi:hypothetical protein Adt_39128 [Abeliophyllum distichum]|uniref:Uncharacterized protein n=1 Tax=Abeliophyllum distichum TaxID=126358 RepID=A0ABD1Q594_9LAMI